MHVRRTRITKRELTNVDDTWIGERRVKWRIDRGRIDHVGIDPGKEFKAGEASRRIALVDLR